MNLTGRAPYQKDGKPVRSQAYINRVRELPCCICEAFGEHQASPTIPHHPIMGRGSTRKVCDTMAIPLCEGHHQGDFDTSKVAVHRAPDQWRRLYGADHEYIEVTQDKLATEETQ